ncbi:MAG: hypothetical protein C4539_03980 [Ignavibacteriales bacterium]|nr:MAG: hypothetical protein C4539_03980 [Ignavibacteriales bacterium]
MFTVNMYNLRQTVKMNLIEMSAYKPPAARQYARIFDSVPKIIRKTGFNIFDYRKVFEDEATKELIRTGNTIGCFYIESPGMRSLLKRTDCDTFEMLTAVSSVIRPGVAESGMMKEFVERHKDPKRRKYIVPEMEKYLGETYGVMIYQEDVIKVAHHIAGLTLEEADLLRRAMSGKMRSHDAMKKIAERFFSSCKSKGISDSITKELWRQIESFAGYAFCKAHSASFALLSFQVAYIKAHYPAEFMAAVLTNQGGYYSAPVYITETQRLGIKVLLPSINQSEYEYKGHGREIRIGLMAVKNLEKNNIDLIVKERENNGRYVSLADFIVRTRLGYEQAATLIKCGAMHCLNKSGPTLLRQLDVFFNSRKLLDENYNDLFIGESIKLECEVETEREFSIEEKCVYEYDTFGYMVTQHPLQFFREEIDSAGVVKAADMLKYNNRRIKMVGWYMASKRIKTSKGEIMKFLSLEDLTGTFEAVLFPKTYAQYAELTLSMGPFLLEGKVDAANGNNIIVDTLSVITVAQAKSITQKDRNNSNFFGDVEKETDIDEMSLISALGKEKLMQSYL